jgi:hypothetical protein
MFALLVTVAVHGETLQKKGGEYTRRIGENGKLWEKWVNSFSGGLRQG